MLYRDKETSKQIIGMSDFLDMLRDFTNFTGKIERDIYKTAKKLQLPDEIDLYNFFEQWGGRAYCVLDSSLPDYYKTFCVYSIPELEQVRNKCKRIEYYISENRFYCLKFKDRGTFLVSEKRYNELKAKKGK